MTRALSIHQLVPGFVYSDTYRMLVVTNDGIFLIRIKNETFFHIFISLRPENKNAVFNVFFGSE